jgi:hypothetical protein
MKNMKTILRILTLLVIFLSVSCAPVSTIVPEDIPGGPGAWIDAPLDGSTIPLAPYDVVVHASDTSGISAFELKINGQIVGTDAVEGDQAGQTLAHISHDWLPAAPGTYLLEVRAANGSGAYGPSAFAKIYVGNIAETGTPVPAAQACTWTAAVNVFVREGPGASIYPELTAVEAGKTFPVVGQSQDQQFWAIEVQPGSIGYVPKAERFGGVTGDCDLPLLPDPATPVPTAVPVIPPQCSDGFDNDGDGRIDYGTNVAAGVNDRECTSPEDNDEANR